MATTIFFATSTGKTSDIADQLKELLPDAGLQDVDEMSSARELEVPGSLICCIPTWNTGADEARSGTAWDQCIEEIPSMNFAGKTIAIVGLGDSASYGDYFCDAMEELYTAFSKAGANLIGKVPTDGYTFNESKSVLNGMFCGLPIDEDNESDLSHERLTSWLNSIKTQL